MANTILVTITAILFKVLGIKQIKYPINKKNGEFDIALKVKDGYEIIETKYLKDKVNNQIIKEEIKQIKGITEINVKDYGFVSINGYQDKIERLKYLIDGDDIYLKNKL